MFIAKKNTMKDGVVEMRHLRKLKHPNILQTKESFFDSDDCMIMIVEFCGYGSLNHQLGVRVESSQCTPFPETIIRKCCVDILRALVHTHQNSIAHMDMKSDNIVINGDSTFKLADFGISRSIEKDGEKVKNLIGTGGYKSPEVANSNILTAKSDVWGLGCILYLFCTVE